MDVVTVISVHYPVLFYPLYSIVVDRYHLIFIDTNTHTHTHTHIHTYALP